MQKVLSVGIEIDKVAIKNLITQQRVLHGTDSKKLPYRELAEKMGLKSHSRIMSAIDPSDDTIPDTEFFLYLAKFTGMKMSEIFALAFPGSETTEVSPRAVAFAYLINRFPASVIEAAEKFVLAHVGEADDEVG